jgi:zinc-finger of acetyl-transferase ESCO
MIAQTPRRYAEIWALWMGHRKRSVRDCPVCGFLYVPNSPTDRREHRSRHRQVEGFQNRVRVVNVDGPNMERIYNAGAEADRTDWPRQPTHRVDVTVIKYGGRGPVYRVMHAGEVLIAKCHCPLFYACRALLARGITGRLELWRAGRGSFDGACDITTGAQWGIKETKTKSIHLVLWSRPTPIPPWRMRTPRSARKMRFPFPPASRGRRKMRPAGLSPTQEEMSILDADLADLAK